VIAGLLLALLVLAPASQTPATDPGRARLAGRPLADALRWIESRGLKVIFSTDLVRPEMRVKDEPKSTRPRQILDEILAPHGLAARAGPRGTVLVVAAPRSKPEPKAVPEAAGVTASPPEPPEQKIGSDASRLRFKETVEVTSTRAEESLHSSIEVPSAQVGATAGGLENIFHTLQLLPGVTGTSDFGSRQSVRGGGPDQNLIVMDGFEIHNPYRLFGLVSGINPETVDRFELFAGAFSARYGDRLSSLLVVDTRDGSLTRKIQGSGNVSMTDANVVLEGRLPGGRRGSWLVTGRRTYYDLVADHITSDVQKFPGFTDAQLKVAWEPSPRHKLTVHGLFSRENTNASVTENDSTNASPELGSAIAKTRTALFAAALDSSLGARAHLRTAAAISQLKDAFNIDTNGCIDTRTSNSPGNSLPCLEPLDVGHDVRVGDVNLREELTIRAGARQLLNTGVELHALRSRLNLASAGDDFPAISLPGLGMLGVGQLPWHEQSQPLASTVDGSRAGAWMEDRIQLTPSVSFIPGVRIDHVNSTRETLVAPRFASTIAIGKATRVRASAGLHFQGPGYEKAFLGGSAFALDLSAPGGPRLRSERAVQAVLGIEHDFPLGLTARVEGYRRRLDRLIVGRLETEAERQARVAQYRFPLELRGDVPAAALITSTPINAGTGQASGVELFVTRKPVSAAARATGWLSYSFGTADRTAYGIRYPFDYDRRHALSVVGQFRLSSRLTLSGSLQAASGLPVTIPAGVRVASMPLDPGGGRTVRVPLFDERGLFVYELDYGAMSRINSTRLPATERIDVRATFHPRSPSGRWVFYVDVINVLNHRNSLSVVSQALFDPHGDRPRVDNAYGGGLPILPTFGIKWRF
jgi:outer membrane receptor for ferrienterochelin and colicin